MSKNKYMFAETMSSAFSPRPTCEVRWVVAPRVTPTSGLTVNVTSVIEIINVSWINTGRAAHGNYEE